MTGPRALVVGCGSIGTRHARNLRALGVRDLRLHDHDREAAGRLATELGALAVPSLDEGLAAGPDLVLVCTPPADHLRTASRAIAADAHVFVEKPLSHDLAGVSELVGAAATARRLLFVGYNLRFDPGLAVLKRELDSGSVGRPIALRSEVGQYLPEWRPGWDYRGSYITQRTQGGVLLEASHEIDCARWLMGEVSSVFCAAGQLSSLEMEAEDVAALTLRNAHGAVMEIHLDCVQRGYARSCKVIGDEGTLLWEINLGSKRIGADGSLLTLAPAAPINEMYLEELRHVLACVAGQARPLVDGREGLRVLEIVRAARSSARTGRVVGLEPIE